MMKVMQVLFVHGVAKFQTLDTVPIFNIDSSIILIQRGRAYMYTNKFDCFSSNCIVSFIHTCIGNQFSVHREYG